jgi:GTP-binding protein
MRVIAEAVQARKGVVAVVNKWDLVEKDHTTLHNWEKELKESFGEYGFIPLVFTSVVEKKRLYKLLDAATGVYEEYHKKIRTSDLNKVLLPVIQQNSPPAVRGKEIKINYITQLKAGAPVFGFFGNHPELIPANYRRFLEKQIRNYWHFKGVPVSVVFKSKRKNT